MSSRSGRLRPWFVGSAILLFLGFVLNGCTGSAPDCGDDAARQTIGTLFRKELMLTPYVRFIDLAGSTTQLDAVFTVRATENTRTCVAFVKFIAKRTDAGRLADPHNKLNTSLLYEMESGRQIYYTVTRLQNGSVKVHVDRVGG